MRKLSFGIRATHLRRSLIAVTIVFALIGCSTTLKEIVLESNLFSNVQGVETHGIDLFQFVGYKRIRYSSVYFGKTPDLQIDLEQLLPVAAVQHGKNSVSVSLTGIGPDFNKSEMEAILRKFLKAIPNYLKIDFEIDLVAVPAPQSFSRDEWKTFRNTVPLLLVFSVDEQETSATFMRTSLFLLTHEMFHVGQRLESRKNRFAKSGTMEDEVVTFLAATCVYFSTFGEMPELNDGSLPEGFTALSETEQYDKRKLEYISQFKRNNNVHESHAAGAFLHYYLISGMQAQEQRRTSKMADICDSVFVDNQIVQIFEQLP